ncbi:MAG: molybdate ABC transporter substrate-binding protein [Actinomycetota bacterium]
MRRTVVIPVVFCALMLPSCGGTSGDGAQSACPSGEGTSLTVLAASSLGPALEGIGEEFVAASGCEVDLRVSLGSSTALAGQILGGAPADVFVAAGESAVRTVTEGLGTTGAPRVVASNTAAVMTRDPAVTGVEDLAAVSGRGTAVGLCVASAPCGALADDVIGTALPGITRAGIVTTEVPSAADLRAKIVMGEIDAGIVFVSDCTGTSAPVRCVGIPAALNSRVTYTAVPLVADGAAGRFVDFLASPAGASVLTGHGFGAP